jgi:XTP/dITP diphosphohydrolase
MTETLLVATHNQGKVVELAELLADLEVALVGLDDLGVTLEVAETGETFRENAVLKAETYAREAGLLTLADDSGLEVDALAGRPGVHTARFGGAALNARERYEYLLRQLEGVPWSERSARFRCVVALARPDGLVATRDGVLPGHIALSPAGDGGFGYDPVFYIDEQEQTLAQLPAAVKNRISHRGRAVAAIKPLLREVIDGTR